MANGYGAQSDEFNRMMLEAMLSQGDIGAQEEQAARQGALADQLRVKAPPQRMDWASQAARGIQGGVSGYLEKGRMEKADAASQARQDFFKQMAEKLRGGVGSPGGIGLE